MDDLALIGAEDPECTHIAGCLTQHDIARIAEDAGEQIKPLLRSNGDHYIVGVG